ncbi:MAG: hypothetical protein AB8F74_07925 [Saprospiraceae bacterium]
MSEEKKFYDTCSECPFASFLDYETIHCSKEVIYDPERVCVEFINYKATIEPKPKMHLLDIANDVDEIIEVEQKKIIEELEKEEIPEINTVEETVIESDEELSNFCIYTKRDCKVYDRPRLKEQYISRVEPSNSLIPFYRRVIRNGVDFIMLKDKGGKKGYIMDVKENLEVYALSEVNEHPIDILLVGHHLFDPYFKGKKLKFSEIKKSFIKHIHSNVKTEFGKTWIQIKSVFGEDDKQKAVVTKLQIKNTLPNMKIVKLLSHSYFYVQEGTLNNYPKKMKLTDGTDAIIFSHEECYTTRRTELESFVSTISTILVVIIGLFIIGGFALKTGWLVVVGIFFIPIVFIVFLFFSLPLYAILNQIVKRL